MGGIFKKNHVSEQKLVSNNFTGKEFKSGQRPGTGMFPGKTYK